MTDSRMPFVEYTPARRRIQFRYCASPVANVAPSSMSQFLRIRLTTDTS
jgi:hypothetical protein